MIQDNMGGLRGVAGQHVHAYRSFGGQDDNEFAYYQAQADLCSEGVEVDALHWIGHFVNGEANFSVDVLDDERLARHFRDGAADPGTLRSELYALGRRLNYDMLQVDKDLRRLRTGSLMRTVFDLGHVAVYWYWIHENEYLVGMTLSERSVHDADEAIASIAENMLLRIGRPRRDYGGFLRNLRDNGATKYDTTKARSSRSLRAPANSAALARRCRDALDPRSLHYVAVFTDGLWTFSEDVLSVSVATEIFGGLASDVRRSYYEQLGQSLRHEVGEFDRMLRTVTRHRPDARLQRTVLDVESGAVYHYAFREDQYLIGVTLYQDQVDVAENRVRILVDDLRADTGWPSRSSPIAL